MESLIKPFITLLAIVNPIGVVPFFIHFTSSFSAAHQARTARVAAFTAFVVLAVSACWDSRSSSSSVSRWPRSRLAAASCCS